MVALNPAKIFHYEINNIHNESQYSHYAGPKYRLASCQYQNQK